MADLPINTIFHPDYSSGIDEWKKWRLAYEGGQQFKSNYIQALSKRETPDDLTARKLLAYVPRFAAAAIDEIKDSIYQRMSEVVRTGGPTTYQRACIGELGGVDLCGSKMTTFVGTDVLSEMLYMKRVGVLLDAPQYSGDTLLAKGDQHPYLTKYCTESIQSWSWCYDNNEKCLHSVLLNENYIKDSQYGLPATMENRYRLMQRSPDGRVLVSFFEPHIDSKGTKTYPLTREVYLDIKKIPFVMFVVPISLMQDIADYEIALMNVESSDIAFIMKSNYPFFYEYYDQKTDPEGFKPPAVPGASGTVTQTISSNRELKVGGSQGRRYPKGLEPPGFVNPNPETLDISIKKGNQLKDDIYRLINLNLKNSARSAESKQESERTLESKLSFLGLILERGEAQIGEIWAMFEGTTNYPKITYPGNYSLKTEDERQKEADDLSKAKNDTPSVTYKREISKKIAQLRIGPNVSTETFKKIIAEIDKSDCFISDVTDLVNAHKEGLIDDKSASLGLGLPEGVIEQAKKDHAERVKIVLEAQGGAQGRGASAGAPELGGTTSTAEKANLPKRGAGV